MFGVEESGVGIRVAVEAAGGVCVVDEVRGGVGGVGGGVVRRVGGRLVGVVRLLVRRRHVGVEAV